KREDVSLDAEVHGLLPTLHVTAHAMFGKDFIDARGTLSVSNGVRVVANATAGKVDVQSFVENGPRVMASSVRVRVDAKDLSTHPRFEVEARAANVSAESIDLGHVAASAALTMDEALVVHRPRLDFVLRDQSLAVRADQVVVEGRGVRVREGAIEG